MRDGVAEINGFQRSTSDADKQVPARGTVRGATCKATGLSLSIRPLRSANSLVPAWRQLATRALEPNIFYEPEYAIPAAIPFGDGVKLLAVHASAAADAPLLAAWPFRAARFRWGVPLGVIAGWTHPFSHLGVPLLDKERAAEALSALLDAPASFGGLPRRALLPLVPDDGAFARLLDGERSRSGLRQELVERHDRACLTPGLSGEPTAHLSSGSRSKLRQEYRRLEKLGAITLETVTAPGAVGAALDDYMRLEATGWKGRVGTAIPDSPEETQFIRDVVANLAAEGRVRIDRLMLADRLIASSITYRHGDTAWYAKISFDEEFAKNSPGSQLVLKMTEAFNAETSLALVDSCAPPDHPLMRRFWSERMSLSNRVVELAGGDRLFAAAARLERKRPLARAYYHKARRWLNGRK